jgi:deazaflavin-dependent oxidoreductase (nitroreductase family)
MNDKQIDLSKLKGEEYCYLTTTGRVSGKLHEIEIWFGMEGNTLFLLSGGGDESDWVRNLRVDPMVSVRVAKHTFSAIARVVQDAEEESAARPMLAAKYQGWRAGKRLSDWAQTALVVAIDLVSNPL